MQYEVIDIISIALIKTMSDEHGVQYWRLNDEPATEEGICALSGKPIKPDDKYFRPMNVTAKNHDAIISHSAIFKRRGGS